MHAYHSVQQLPVSSEQTTGILMSEIKAPIFLSDPEIDKFPPN